MALVQNLARMSDQDFGVADSEESSNTWSDLVSALTVVAADAAHAGTQALWS